jgi:uncharacterized membrane protein YphA (DoxX/SURF4 family)
MQMAMSVTRGTVGYSRKASLGLWAAQALLAAVFLFAGAFKLAAPWEEMAAQMPVALPELFVRFIALCEVLGAFGLILPGLTRVRRSLTPVAAAGLLVVMVGATTLTVATVDVPSAALPLVCGVLAAAVVRGRASWLADR